MKQWQMRWQLRRGSLSCAAQNLPDKGVGEGEVCAHGEHDVIAIRDVGQAAAGCNKVLHPAVHIVLLQAGVILEGLVLRSPVPVEARWRPIITCIPPYILSSSMYFARYFSVSRLNL